MAGTLALVVGFLVLLAWDLLGIKRDLEAGRASLDTLTLDAAASTGLTKLADDAARHMSSASSRAHGSLPLRALSVMPFFGDQVDGIRKMADVTASVGRAGASAAQKLDAQLDKAGEPAGRLALLDLAMDEIDTIEGIVDRSDLGPSEQLASPLRDAHADLERTLRRARRKLDEGRALIAPVRQMLAGPTSLLLLAANNSEMAGGAGLTLSAGVLTFDHGDFELGDVVDAGSLRLPASVPIPESIRSIYSPTGVGIDLRSTSRSPDLSTMGPIALQIMAEHGVDHLDGVLVVDAVALADLMKLIPKVEVAGKTITEENVLATVLHDNYVEFDSSGDRAQRVDYQGEIAKAIFQALTSGDASGIDLAEVLLEASEGRHLLLWSPDPDLQAVWQELAVDGALDPTGLMVSFQNYGADKMDWYLRPSAAMDVRLLPSGDYRASLKMTLPMPARSELKDVSAYILGPGPDRHAVFLTVHLPQAAYDITTPDARGFRTQGTEGPMQVRTFLADVPLGTTFERTVEFSLPRKVPALTLLPSARMVPMPLEVDGVATVDDAVPTPMTWLAAIGPAGPDHSAPWPLRWAALLAVAATLAAASLVALGAWQRSRGVEPALVPFAVLSAVAGLALFAVAAAVALVLVWTGTRV